jgi:hypothetical protein
MQKARLVKVVLFLIGYAALAIRAEEKFAGAPEPGTLGMMGLGLIAMAVGLRRKS